MPTAIKTHPAKMDVTSQSQVQVFSQLYEQHADRICCGKLVRAHRRMVSVLNTDLHGRCAHGF